MKAVREEEVKLRGIGFMKQVGFKQGERGCMDEQSVETEFLHADASFVSSSAGFIGMSDFANTAYTTSV